MNSEMTSTGPVLQPQAVVEVCLCHHVRRAARAVTSAFDTALAPLHLTSTQFDLLASITALESPTVPALESLLAMDRTTLSRTLKPLKTAGLVLSRGAAGRRAGTLQLTPAGEDLLRQALPVWQGAQRRLAEAIGGGKTSVLLDALDAVTRAAAI